MIRSIVLLFVLATSGMAHAHPLAPALLELREQASGRYSVLWRTSASRVQRRDVIPQLPATCHEVSPPVVGSEENESLVARWTVQCAAGGIAGQALSVQGLERSGINVILRIEPRAGAVIQQLLDAQTPAFVMPQPAAQVAVFPAYLRLGVEHLLTGLDHVLFVFGLWLLVRGFRPLFYTITAFTLGHSLTLALATLGLVRVNPALTELGIALSILVLALEIVRPAQQRSAWLMKRPWAVAGLFGLLHGMGFAGALAEVGLPAGEIPLSLLAFNLGIEFGQLVLIAVLLALGAAWATLAQTLRAQPVSVLRALPPYVIGALAAFWCIERAATMWV